MDTASKILIVGGLGHVAYSCVIGFVLAQVRLRGPDTGTYLPLAHRISLWWGFLFFGLVWAVALSTLSPGMELLAVWLIVASSVLSDIEPIVNLLRGVKDPVAERSPAFYSGGVSVAAVTVGVAILLVGVVRAV